VIRLLEGVFQMLSVVLVVWLSRILFIGGLVCGQRRMLVFVLFGKAMVSWPWPLLIGVGISLSSVFFYMKKSHLAWHGAIRFMGVAS